jgi:hypothetical protein
VAPRFYFSELREKSGLRNLRPIPAADEREKLPHQSASARNKCGMTPDASVLFENLSREKIACAFLVGEPDQFASRHQIGPSCESVLGMYMMLPAFPVDESVDVYVPSPVTMKAVANLGTSRGSVPRQGHPFIFPPALVCHCAIVSSRSDASPSLAEDSAQCSSSFSKRRTASRLICRLLVSIPPVMTVIRLRMR